MTYHYCHNCDATHKFDFVREWTNSKGQVWEVYVCSNCGAKRQFAVG